MCVRRIKSLKGNLNKIIQGVFKIFNIVNCNQLNTIEESTIIFPIPVIDLSINANKIQTTEINSPPAKSALNN
jgi:hypothetical protein